MIGLALRKLWPWSDKEPYSQMLPPLTHQWSVVIGDRSYFTLYVYCITKLNNEKSHVTLDLTEISQMPGNKTNDFHKRCLDQKIVVVL